MGEEGVKALATDSKADGNEVGNNGAVVQASLALSTTATMNVRVGGTTHLWLLWSEIAIAQHHVAQNYRATALTARRDKLDQGRLFSKALGQETRAAMVAVAAAAHAIDGFYGSSKRFITLPPNMTATWAANGTKRSSRILETFKCGFALGSKGNTWPSEVRWLFDIRDAAVHFEEQTQDFVPHPTGPETTCEHVTYSLESANRAVTLLLDVLSTCQANPRPQHASLVTYVAAFGASVAQLSDDFHQPLSTEN